MLRLAHPRVLSILTLWLALLAFAFAPALFSQATQQQTQPPPTKGASPSLNETWKSTQIEPLVERLEAESREIYRERARLAALVAPKPGSAIADVGAGSGFMVEEFAKLVGAKGKVYAVDINAKMMERVAARAKSLGLANVETVVTREDSVDLAPASVDMVFVCDTYHHFEYPDKSLRGIYEALRPGGELIIVDFHRVPGKTRPDMLEHVRGTREEFTREITAAGFELLVHETADFLSENYVLRFKKEPGTQLGKAEVPATFAKCIYCLAPRVTEAAAKDPRFAQGIVVLRVLITSEGRASEMSVVKTPGWGLEESAMEAIKTWRFEPSRNAQGKPVTAWNTVEMVFRVGPTQRP